MTDEERARSALEGARTGADLRHDLLTPVNQIIGYGEMVEEGAIELQRVELAAGVRVILGLGREVSGLIKRMLSATGPMSSPADLPELRSRLSSLLDRPLGGSLGADAGQTDG